jgi:hypothetical protein
MEQAILDATYQYFLRTFAETGAPPSTQAMIKDLSLDSTEAAHAHLDELEKKGCIYRDPVSRQIVSAYPFSAVPTAHSVTFPSGHSVYAMCAIDALGMPSMLDTDATIHSVCAACGAPITIEVQGGQITHVVPSEIIVVYAQGTPDCCAATDQCPFINFFCSPAHAQTWQSEHPHLILKPMSLTEALASGQRTFGNLLRGGALDLSTL